MKKLLFSAFICFLAIQSFGQISTDERPPSFDNYLTNRLLQEQKTDLRVMPSLDMSQIQKEDEKDAQRGANLDIPMLSPLIYPEGAILCD